MKFKKDNLQRYKHAIKTADYVQQKIFEYFSELEDYIQCKMSVTTKLLGLKHYEMNEMEVRVTCSNMNELLQNVEVDEIKSIRYVTYAYIDDNTTKSSFGYIPNGILLQIGIENPFPK